MLYAGQVSCFCGSQIEGFHGILVLFSSSVYDGKQLSYVPKYTASPSGHLKNLPNATLYPATIYLSSWIFSTTGIYLLSFTFVPANSADRHIHPLLTFMGATLYVCCVLFLHERVPSQALLCIFLAVAVAINIMVESYIYLSFLAEACASVTAESPFNSNILILSLLATSIFQPLIRLIRQFTALSADRYFLMFLPFEIAEILFTILFLLLSIVARLLTRESWVWMYHTTSIATVSVVQVLGGTLNAEEEDSDADDTRDTLAQLLEDQAGISNGDRLSHLSR